MENERRQNRQHSPQWASQNVNGQPHRCQTVRSPLKFIKGEFRESDYESDYDCRIQPIWRPYESGESGEPVYKPVRPSFRTPGRQTETPTPTPPVQRYTPVQRTAPVQLKQITTPAFELPKPGSPPEIGFAPAPFDVHHRSVSFVESEHSESSVQRTTHFLSSAGDGQAGYGTLERNAEAKRLQRVDEMRKRFEQKSLVPTEPSSVQMVSSQSISSTQGIRNFAKFHFAFGILFLILLIDGIRIIVIRLCALL